MLVLGFSDGGGRRQDFLTWNEWKALLLVKSRQRNSAFAVVCAPFLL